MSGRYRSPEAFRSAMEARLKKHAAATGRPLDRVIQLYLMQRFLARILAVNDEAITVKGGLALELRLARARTTKDVDVRMSANRDGVLEQLRRATEVVSPVDHLRFTIDENPNDPEIDGDGVIYQGLRFRAQGHFIAKPYGAVFGVDVAFGDPMTGPRDMVSVPNLLDIVDAPPLRFPLYPIATHLAEKLHAYTLPRKHPNHRIRDLLDMALVASELTIEGAALCAALVQTFGFRASHGLPTSLPPPPEHWRSLYARERRVHGLPWPSIDEVHAAAARFFDPVLDDERGTWDPATQAWRATA